MCSSRKGGGGNRGLGHFEDSVGTHVSLEVCVLSPSGMDADPEARNPQGVSLAEFRAADVPEDGKEIGRLRTYGRVGGVKVEVERG